MQTGNSPLQAAVPLDTLAAPSALALTRYWFRSRQGLGFGVTAYSIYDAQELLVRDCPSANDVELTDVMSDIDVRTLDKRVVAPNSGPLDARGVWYPYSKI
jgi:hypothetical protein